MTSRLRLVPRRGGCAAAIALVSAFLLGHSAPASATTLFSEDFEDVPVPALPGGWTTTDGGARTPWSTTTTTPVCGSVSAFVDDATAASDHSLVTPPIAIPSSSLAPTLRFNHKFQFEKAAQPT